MDKFEFCGLATALRTMALPPADAGFEGLLAKLEAVAGTRGAPDIGQAAVAFETNIGRVSDRAQPDRAALAV